MAVFTEVAALIPTLGGHLAPACAEDLPAALSALSDAEILAVFEESAELAKQVEQVEQIRLLSIGVVAARSKRSRGTRDWRSLAAGDRPWILCRR